MREQNEKCCRKKSTLFIKHIKNKVLKSENVKKTKMNLKASENKLRTQNNKILKKKKNPHT